MHVSHLNSVQLLRLSTWLRGQGKDLVATMMETAGTLTPEQEEVANGKFDQDRGASGDGHAQERE
jgi:hypothetical protein